MNLVKRNPGLCLCKQQMRRASRASAQSHHHLCCALPRYYNNSHFFIQHFNQAGFFSCTCWFESHLVVNSALMISRDWAHMVERMLTRIACKKKDNVRKIQLCFFTISKSFCKNHSKHSLVQTWQLVHNRIISLLFQSLRDFIAFQTFNLANLYSYNYLRLMTSRTHY